MELTPESVEKIATDFMRHQGTVPLRTESITQLCPRDLGDGCVVKLEGWTVRFLVNPPTISPEDGLTADEEEIIQLAIDDYKIDSMTVYVDLSGHASFRPSGSVSGS